MQLLNLATKDGCWRIDHLDRPPMVLPNELGSMTPLMMRNETRRRADELSLVNGHHALNLSSTVVCIGQHGISSGAKVAPAAISVTLGHRST